MSAASIVRRCFGSLADGTEIDLLALEHPSGIAIEVLNYGCIIRALRVPDAKGAVADVVLGCETLDGYVRDGSYFGCVAGRYANRIAGGKFTLDGETYRLATNNEPGGKPCHLHGGDVGFNKRAWDYEATLAGEDVCVRFSYLSPAGEEGYPGTVEAEVAYYLLGDRTLRIEYRAVCDEPTPINLTNHSYFSLGGHDAGAIDDHVVTLMADRMTPTDAGLIPTGELRPVAGTPFDFTKPTPIGQRIDADDEQLRFGGGYDHNYVLSRWDGKLRQAARVEHPGSGRWMEVWTTEPALQFYGGNFLDGTAAGKDGQTYPRRSGLCLETQHYPDSPNQPEFPSTILRPGEAYQHATEFRLGAS